MDNHSLMHQLWAEFDKVRLKAIMKYGYENMGEWTPTTEEELSVWDKITDPDNYDELSEYVKKCGKDINKTAKKFFDLAVKSSLTKMETHAVNNPNL